MFKTGDSGANSSATVLPNFNATEILFGNGTNVPVTDPDLTFNTATNLLSALNLSVPGTTTLNTGFTGIIHAVSGVLSASLIVNADVSAAAAIAFSKLAALPSANILVGSAGNVATAVAMTGDISITNGGLTAYAGTVPINRGGTGQTTASLGFGALSPLTTKGDILGFTTLNVRKAVGANNTILCADSAQADGLDWKTIASITTTETFSDLTSGTGATYNVPAGAKYLIVRLWGGGGGGGGVIPGTGYTTGGNGGTTTFGSTTALGGQGGTRTLGGAGGTGGATGTGTIRLRIPGAQGNPGGMVDMNLGGPSGGATSILGGAGCGGANASAGGNGIANTGGGGGGAGGSLGSTTSPCSGGGGAEFAEIVVTSPAASYTYTIAAGGTASGTISGGTGGSGRITVEVKYQ